MRITAGIEHLLHMKQTAENLFGSDMELFIFPELLFALVLANIMSPRLWKWRNWTDDKRWEKKVDLLTG